MNPVPWLQMTNMISYQGLVRTFHKRGLLAVTQKQNGMFMRCDDSPGFFHGSAAFTKSINQITCCTFNMLPTWLSPVTVGNQYIVSLAAAFPTICCPCPFYFVIGQCEKRHHSGDAADGMMFIQGRKIGRYWLPAGRRAGQRAASVAGFKNAGGNLKMKPHTLRNFANFTQHASFRSQQSFHHRL